VKSAGTVSSTGIVLMGCIV
jgi:hypothetical protein